MSSNWGVNDGISDCGPRAVFGKCTRPRKQDKWTSPLRFVNAKDFAILIPACILALCSGLAEPALSIIFSRFFEAFSQLESGAIDSNDFNSLSRAAIFTLIGISGLMLLLKGAYLCLWIIFGELQASNAKILLFQKLLEQEIAWYESRKSGISAQLTEIEIYIREFQLGVSQPLGFVLNSSVQCIASMVVALYYSWRLAMLLIAATVLATLCLSFLSTGLAVTIESHHNELAHASKRARHIMENIATIKCCNAEKHERLSCCTLISRASTFYLKQARITATRIGFMGGAITLILVLALLYATTLIHQEISSISATMTTFFCCLMVAEGFQTILPNLIVLERAWEAASALNAVLNSIEESESVGSRERNGKAPLSLSGNIVFQDVSFAYAANAKKLVLHKANMKFTAGETTFIIGKSGSGKSTIAKLIQNQHEVSGGQITIDGIDVRQLNKNWLRNNISILQQSGRLFHETIFQNVAFGWHGSLTQAFQAVWDSLHFAEIAEQVSLLPNGWETMVGSGGTSLSGGQLQRLLLARTYLSNTPILILDEPTSSLDPRLRNLIMSNIREWRKSKTTIIITHDLSQITQDDNTYLLKEDGVITSGADLPLQHLPRHEFSLFPRPPTAMSYRTSLGTQDNDLDIVNHASFAANGRLARASNRLSFMPNQRKLSRTVLFQTDIGTLWYPPSVSQTSRNASLVSTNDVRYRDHDRDNGISTQHGLLHPMQNSASAPSLPVNGLWMILKSLWPHLGSRHRIFVLGGICCSVLYAACPAVFSFLVVQNFCNWSATEAWQHRARDLALAGTTLAVVDAASAFLMHYLFEQVGQHWCDALRSKAIAHILEQPKSWFDAQHASFPYLTLVLNRNAEELRNLVGRYCALVLVALIMMCIALFWALKICWKITMLGFASMPLLYGITKVFQMISEHWEGKTSESNANITAIFDETFSDIGTVRNLALEPHFYRKCLAATKRAVRIGIERGIATGLCFGVSESAIYFITVAIFAYGVALVKSSEDLVLPVLQALALLLFSTSNVNAILGYIPQISSSVETGLKLLELTSIPVSSQESGEQIIIDLATSNMTSLPVIFNNITFCYPTRMEHAAVSRLKVTFQSGQWTAIVGASGSGKSTIASLLLKLYEGSFANGENDTDPLPYISIFGHDIRSIHTKLLRKLVSVVPQHPVIVPGTVRSNILYGDLHPDLQTDDNMEEAAKASDIHDFVLTMPQGYETLLGPGGLTLSGGQAQRIVIARALARRPSLLILDEATSSLDGDSAEQIRGRLIGLLKGALYDGVHDVSARTKAMTIVSITHDIEMMAAADHVVVIENGTLGEEGTFIELLEKKGLLYELLRDAFPT